MALFKKKNQPEEVKEAVTADVNYKELVLKALDKKMEKGNLYDECIIMPRGFTIDVKIGRVDVKEDLTLLQVIFVVNHDEFDEELIDPVDAQGKTAEEAAKMAVDIFYGGVWHPLDQALTKKNPIEIPVMYLGQRYDFNMYAQSIVRIGSAEKGDPTMLVKYVLNQMPKYLGSKKYYWLRIYLAKHKDRQIIEVRVNGSVCLELSQYFVDYVNSWDADSAFICEKQYAIFVNKADDECPFEKATVMKGAKFALEKFAEIKDKDAYAKMTTELEEMVEDKNLAAEIRIFVPEVMAKLTLGYREGDSLFLIEGENKIEFKKTQLRSYFYIQQAVIEYLNTQPTQQAVQEIVSKSVAFRELRKIIQASNEKAKAEGKEANFTPQDMFVPGTAYMIDTGNYKAW